MVVVQLSKVSFDAATTSWIADRVPFRRRSEVTGLVIPDHGRVEEDRLVRIRIGRMHEGANLSERHEAIRVDRDGERQEVAYRRLALDDRAVDGQVAAAVDAAAGEMARVAPHDRVDRKSVV